MATTVTFAYGSLYGPLCESAKADMRDPQYGWLYGPLVGPESPPAAAAGTVFFVQGLTPQRVGNTLAVDQGV